MLALRYLRSRRDERFVSLISWSSAIGVAIGVAALIIVLSVMYGFDAELKDKILGFSSHVDIQGPGESIEGWQSWMKRAQTLPGIAEVRPYVSTQVLASFGTRATGAMLKGVPVRGENRLAKHIIHGHFLTSNASPFQAVIGKDLAHLLGIQVGDRIRLITPTPGISPSGAAPRMRAFTVVGIFNSGFYEYDVGLILTTMDAVQRLNRMGDRITGIAVFLHDRDKAIHVAQLARSIMPPGAWITDWEHRHMAFFRALNMERVVMGIILSLIVLVAVFNMVASLVMVVMERRKEIAILKTIGATHGSVMRIFLMMGALLGGLGTLSGMIFGLLLAWKLGDMLAWFERVTGVTILPANVYYIDHVPSIIDPVSVTIVVSGSLIMAIGATFYPAWRAANVPPADALRYE